MGADPDARSPDFRVPDGVKGNDGLRDGEEEEEESLDATDARRRTEEPEDAASEHGGGAAGKSELPSTKSGPAERTSRKETSIHRHVPGGTWLNKLGESTWIQRQSRGEPGKNNQRDIKEEKHTKTPN
ncbi:hypothetical protein NDU88_006591 [Pleurodeles waltl]|uniref:Uncharacterized protein n=1 Tax=Pleurodeles waltl TaxID=8319 RepID=A0AAV7TX96_PLEWA|nr:hypothetical protein NDU88_006591 [Pleurodeles waltl]